MERHARQAPPADGLSGSLVPALPLDSASLTDVVFFGLAFAIVPFALRNLPRIWRHELRTFDRMNPYWPWGETLWRGWVRMMPLGVIAMTILLPLGTAGFVVPEDPTGPFVRPLWWVLPVLGALALFWVLAAGVVLLNRPKRLVAPHLRSQPGALEEWWAHWRRRRTR